ncbi:MAG: hypothetical protein CMD87_05075 [Gammaproteobacteria bacterium]|nr:hypothetical protein [Gammaproteobacteria bacterium]
MTITRDRYCFYEPNVLDKNESFLNIFNMMDRFSIKNSDILSRLRVLSSTTRRHIGEVSAIIIVSGSGMVFNLLKKHAIH